MVAGNGARDARHSARIGAALTQCVTRPAPVTAQASVRWLVGWPEGGASAEALEATKARRSARRQAGAPVACDPCVTSLQAIRSLSILSLVALAGCATGAGAVPGPGVDDPASHPLAIDSPADGALLSSRAVHVTGRAVDLDAVTVNGVEAAVVEGHFALDLTLAEGEQRIEAVAADESAAVTVRIDETAPQIVVESPTPGAFVPGTSLEVRGRVIDASVATLQLDDQTIEVAADGRFRVTHNVEPGAIRMRLHAEDAAGNESWAYAAALVGTFGAPGMPVESAAALRLGTDAIHELERGATAMLGAMDIATLARAENPVANGTWGELRVDDVRYSGVAVTLQPRAGSGLATVGISGLRGDLSYDPPLLPVVHGNISATTANVVATVMLGATGGRVTATYQDSSVTLDGFSYDIAAVPAFIEDLLRGRVRDFVQTKIDDAVAAQLPAFLANAVQSIPSRQTVTVLGAPLVVQGGVRALEVDPSGLRIVADVGVRADAPVVGRERLGALVRGGSLGAPSGAAGVAVSASLDALDQTLFATWAAGVMGKHLEGLMFSGAPVTVGTLSLIVPAIRGQAPADAPISIDLESILPPVLTETPDGVEVRFADVQAVINARVAGRDQRLFTLSLGGAATTRPVLRGDGIAMEAPHIDVTADVVQGPPGMPTGPRLDALLHDLAGDSLVSMLDFAPFHLPALVGFTITPSSVSVSGNYLRFDASLRYGAPR